MTETQPGPLASPPGHPDLDTLADYGAGVLDPAATTQLQRHVDSCTRCQGVLAGSAAVPDLLRTLPPITMPPAIEARIFAALDAERQASRGGAARPDPRQPGPVPVRPVASLDAARERRASRFRRLSLVAAALVLVVGGGAVAIAVGANHNNATGSGDRGGGTVAAENGPKVNGIPPKDAAGLPTYDRQTITTDASLLLQILQGQHGPLSPSVDVSHLRDCERGVAAQVSGVGATPTGVIPVDFEGTRSYALVYVTPTSRTVVVVSQECTGTDPRVLFTGPLK